MKKSTKPTYCVRNWGEYNHSLVKRGSLTVWFDAGTLAQWRNTQSNGRRGADAYYSDLAIECMLTLRVVYHLPLRQTEGLICSIAEMMKVNMEIPDYTTLCRRGRRLRVDLKATASQQARHIVIDPTGVRLYGEAEWKARQHGASKRRTWRTVHLAVDRDSGEIIASEVSGSDVGDCELLPTLLERIDGQIAAVGADGAYDTAEVYTAIEQRGARSVIPPCRGAKIWRHGNTKGPLDPRDGNLRQIRRHGRKKWKKQSGYHQRSLAETAMYRLKTIFSDKLSARGFESQCVEVFIKCRAMNIMTRLGMPDSYAVVP